MRISGRLLLLLAIPLVALLSVTGYGVGYGASRAADASQLQERTDLGKVARGLVRDLQAERNLLIADGATDPGLREQIRSSGEDLRTRSAEIGGRVAHDAELVASRLTALDRVASAGLGGRVALRNYSMTVDDLLDLAGTIADPKGAVDGAAASTVDYLARAGSASAEERDLLLVLSQNESLDATAFQQLTSLASAQESYVSLAAVSATDQGLVIRVQQVGHAMRAADVIRRDAFSAFDSGRDQEWRDGLDARTQELASLQDEAALRARAVVDDLLRSSRTLFVSAALSAIAILLVSAYLLRRAVRTIARPLQDLAVQAEDVARSRLPEAVKAQQELGREELHLPALRATGAAEVHEVASAFNDIQDTALRLAGEQAALRLNQSEALTNLGRRNQTLLARQLDFISSLETRETDPVFLEHLFKLDHLASRMRRNAESLLILAGSETPRRRRTPAPVTEVVRAAMSEVEEFERVRIGHLRDATVSGPAVIDLVHLLAELIENALGFSPPDSTVEIDGRSLGQGGYQFAIIDHGVGMTDLELLAANHRMAGTDEVEGMPTRYLGQYVVAKLATKVGAMVHVQPTSGGRGVTATVNLPGSAMLGSPDRSAVARPMPGTRKSREQGPVPFAPGAGVSELARAAAGAGTEAWGGDELAVFDGTAGAFEAESFQPGSFGSEPFEAESFEPQSSGSEPSESIGSESFESEPFQPGSLEPSHEEVADGDLPHKDLPDSDLPDSNNPDASAVDSESDDGASEWEPVEWPPLETTREGEPVPPPVPSEVPEQSVWAPADAAMPSGPTPGEVASEPVLEPLGSRAGGLTRRVPGASLAERDGSSAASDATPAPERSATGVKSMLSSFQAGRSRGRHGESADDALTIGDDAGGSGTEGEGSEDPMDWRSTQ